MLQRPLCGPCQLDVPMCRCKMKSGVPTWKNEYIQGALRSYKGTAGGLAVQIAASKDSETAADTTALSGTANRQGSCSWMNAS